MPQSLPFCWGLKSGPHASVHSIHARYTCMAHKGIQAQEKQPAAKLGLHKRKKKRWKNSLCLATLFWVRVSFNGGLTWSYCVAVRMTFVLVSALCWNVRNKEQNFFKQTVSHNLEWLYFSYSKTVMLDLSETDYVGMNPKFNFLPAVSSHCFRVLSGMI